MGIPRIVGNHFEEARLVDFLSSIFRLVDTGDRRDPTKTDLMTSRQDGFGDYIVIYETSETTICYADGVCYRRKRPISIEIPARCPSWGDVIDDAKRKQRGRRRKR